MLFFRRRTSPSSPPPPLPRPVAVVDVETTGLSPSQGHRIVEIAVLVLDADGRVQDRFETLVNPRRDLGPVHIHGIRPSDVRDAPEFGDVAGHIAERIEGRAIVAHNARFDARFLAAEFERIGAPLPSLPCICTLELARATVLAPNYRLATVCAVCGLPVTPAHAAAHDADATAKLFVHLWRQRPDPLRLELATWEQPGGGARWPRLAAAAAPRPRGTRSSSPSPIATVLDAVPVDGADHGRGADAYLELLSRVLEDRSITPEEAAALRETAQEWGLSRPAVEELHRRYLGAVIRAAWADGRLTDREREDIAEISRLLGLPQEVADAMSSRRSGASEEPRFTLPDGSSLVGLSVCFTGESQFRWRGEPLTREQAEELARKAGLIVHKSVTKRLDLLVCADPATESSKARLARRYGIRIMAEAEFWRRLGVDVE